MGRQPPGRKSPTTSWLSVAGISSASWPTTWPTTTGIVRIAVFSFDRRSVAPHRRRPDHRRSPPSDAASSSAVSSASTPRPENLGLDSGCRSRLPSPGATLGVPAKACRSRPRAVISPPMSTHLQQPITPEPVVDGLIDSSDPTRLAGQRPTPQYHGTVPPPFAAAGSSPPALRPNKTSSQVGSARRGRSDRYPTLSQAPRGRDRVEVAA